MEEKALKNLIKSAINRGVDLKYSSDIPDNANLISYNIEQVTKCDNPNYNYTFTGSANIAIPTDNGYMEYSGCVIEGDVLIDNGFATIINGIFTKKGLSD